MSLLAAEDRLGTVAASHAGARWLARWHLLSLDAPTVAACWTWLVLATLRGRTSLPLAGAMFVAVWLVYVLDRLLDAAGGGNPGRPRHVAHAANRVQLVAAAVLALPVLLVLCTHLSRGTLRAEAGLAVALALWLAAVHLRPAWRLPKELAVGVFFAAAVFLPAGGWPALPWAACFGLLCMVNALYIRRWEEGGTPGALPDALTDARTDALTDALTRALLRHVRGLASAAFATPLLLASLAGHLVLALPLSLAALLLLRLDRSAARTEPTTLRALADAALLTPLLTLPWLALLAR